jgi:hypothetical protein
MQEKAGVLVNPALNYRIKKLFSEKHHPVKEINLHETLKKRGVYESRMDLEQNELQNYFSIFKKRGVPKYRMDLNVLNKGLSKGLSEGLSEGLKKVLNQNGTGLKNTHYEDKG